MDIVHHVWCLILINIITHSHSTKCNWKLDILQSTSLTTETILIDDGTLTDTSTTVDAFGPMSITDILTSQGGPRSYPYMLQMKPICADQMSADEARRYAFAGGAPLLTIIEDHQISNSERFVGATAKTYEGALIDKDQLLGTSSYEMQTLAWVVPLELNPQSTVFKITILTDGVTSVLPQVESHILSLSGFKNSDGRRPSLLGTTIANAVTGTINAPFHIIAIPNTSPTLAMVTNQSPGTPTYILSEDQFETYTVLQTPTVDASLSNKCTCSGALLPTKELDVVSLSDRLLFITKKGVVEVLGNMRDKGGKHVSSFSSNMVHSGCVRHLEPSQQTDSPQDWGVVILGGCSAYNHLFYAHYIPGNGGGISFNEVLDNAGRRVCDVSGYASNDCSVVAAVSIALSTTKIVVLVHHTSSAVYTVWEMAGEWVKLSTLPDTLPSTITTKPYLVSSDPPISGVSYNINGLSASHQASKNLAFWGSRLLYSPDAGAHVYLVQDFDGGSNIVQFAASSHHWYAILTDTQEVWVGMFGEESLKKIYPSSAWDVVHFEDTSPAPGSSFTIVSLLFDLDYQLYMLLVKDGESDISRLNVKFEEILSHIAATEEFSSGATINVFNEVLTDASLQNHCPFDDMIFEIPVLSWYTQEQEMVYHVPLLFNTSGIHNQESILIYQAVVYSTNVLRDKFSDTQYLRPYHDYLQMWKMEALKKQEYFSYLFDNDLSPARVLVDPNSYTLETRETGESPVWVYKIPHVIYMTHMDNITFSIFLYMADDEADRFPGDDKGIQLGISISNATLLNVFTYRTFNPVNNSVKYTLDIRERGNLHIQKKPGIGLSSASITLSIIGAPFNCFQEETSNGVYEMTVMLGCPPTQRILFDAFKTKENTRAHGDQTFDCYYSNPDLPCFYFFNAFYPVFRVIDSATGETRTWHGNYTLKIIGGGEDGPKQVKNYSTEDIFRYNSLTTGEAALIMSPISTSFTNDEGWVVYNGDNNGISWFCQAESPCSLVFPKFPKNAEYVFLVEFSNMDVDHSTNCDFTMQFLVHLHGLPINNIALSAPLVLVAIVFVCIWFALFYYYQLHKTEIHAKIENWLIRICYTEEEEEAPIDKTLTDEELEELAAKDWRQALQIRVEKLQELQEEDEEEDYVEHRALTIEPSRHEVPSRLAVPVRTAATSSRHIRLTKRKDRRTSVGLGATLDGRVSILGGHIDHSEVMRLRTLNKVYIKRQNEEKDT